MKDIIYRQEAIDAMEESKRIYFDRRVVIGKMQDIVSDLPSAEPKTGKWIDACCSAFDGTKQWYRECSECKYERDDDNPDKDTHYCPNCGAKMENAQ